MTYRAPVSDIVFTMRHVASLDRALEDGLYPELTADLVETILGEAGRFANDVIAPLNREGDKHGVTLKDGVVTTAPGWKEAYKAWTEAGWNALPGPAEYGGQGLPTLLNSACVEMWNAASMAFGIGPVLTMGAIEALVQHGTEYLKSRYLEKLVSGEWTATMNLTEPQAGSDLAALRSRAEPAGDGTYKITGQKIFITYGEHDLTENIVHLVLARLPEAPVGTRGISLFVVPKFLPDGTRNDVRCHSIEHKLGIHASPTCTMIFGDNGGAIGWLLGEENRGLNCMFTMMNNARLAVGLQGVAIAERAYQLALAYAHERRQGRAPGGARNVMSPIVEHPDIQRNLLTMKALTAAARSICYLTAEAIDRAHLEQDESDRRKANERASLLTPVAKAFSTDIGVEVASLGVQVHGGMGFIEETGAAQHYRDARIAPIYEGTNGIQALDLVTRKLPLAGGETVAAQIASMRDIVARLTKTDSVELTSIAPTLDAAIGSLERATNFLLRALSADAPLEAIAGATPYLSLFGIVQGGGALAQLALAAHEAMLRGETAPAHRGRIALARFFADHIVTRVDGLERTVVAGMAPLLDAELVLANEIP
ncbi:acyl-CoA dehydrogenase [Microvirga flavescens]|uniref:acyl-CoA dehydrogenase n=1 Tax=Microvirga flavescens TaxID=2249811 RepID=UPI000DD585C1|nr:acyl-CoA dehydrogenase [Microvirga flavescens]